MSLLDSAIIASMVEDLGMEIAIDGESSSGIFYEAGKQVQMFDGSISTTGPLLIVNDVSGITVNKTIITINDVDYQPINIQQDRSGWWSLNLTRDF